MEFQTCVKTPIFLLFLAADLTYEEVSDNCCVLCEWLSKKIGHFRAPKTLTFKMRPNAQPLL